MNGRRVLNYLLLNVFVSACVTGTILYWYDRNYRAVNRPVEPQSSTSAAAAAPSAPLETDIEIASVVGAGSLQAEVAVVRFRGEGELNLASWQLKDSDGNTFTFPRITLYTNGAVQVHTDEGVDTIIDLHWGAGRPVWQSGEEARLLDGQGTLRAVYRVP